MRKTKIICTLGPSTDNYETLKEMVKAGMNVARFNMAHAEYDIGRQRMDMIKKISEE